jgi:SpoVK/Ycf46/Vps4 family AAA+-type ATPase
MAGRPLLIADLRHALASTLPLATTLSLLRRESILRGANLFLSHAEALFGGDPQCLQQRLQFQETLASLPFTVFVSTDSPVANGQDSVARAARSTFEFPIPAVSDRILLWSDMIRKIDAIPPSEAGVALLANRFALTGGEIEDACRLGKTNAVLRDGEAGNPSLENLHSAARSSSSHGLRKLAQKVESIHQWSDLILPPRYLQQLREVCSAEKYRSVIYSEWGFDQRLAQGKGLNVLFCGASGTGKTMSAGILARELSLDLYKIDLSTVVSKYIGETEKHLSLIFREAASSNAILLFDEADALFGKRSEVKDAHDRYANVEVSYLLQKMEEYQGVVIMATNFRKNIDDAFTRRIHYVVDFPFPSAEYRERIWRSLIPATAPLAGDVDFAFLARQFEFAGGNIRNVVLAAAFLAVEQNTGMRMEHFIRATSRELQKLGKLASRTEFREFYDLTRDPV